MVDNYFSSHDNMIQKQPMRPFMRQSKNYVAVIQRIDSNVQRFKPNNRRLPECYTEIGAREIHREFRKNCRVMNQSFSFCIRIRKYKLFDLVSFF